VSPFRPSFPRQPQCVSAVRSPITDHNSRRLILLRTLCRREKNQLLCNQANPNSLHKTPGVGHPGRNCGSSRQRFLCPAPHESQVTDHKSRLFICLQPLYHLFVFFSALPSFVFSHLQPLFAKHPGGGYRCELCGSAFPLAVIPPTLVFTNHPPCPQRIPKGRP
jgi:hypothetical protein